MNKDSIIQFVCFETNIDVNEFLSAWEKYFQKAIIKPGENNLKEQMLSKGRYRYVSKHISSQDDDFKFVFSRQKQSQMIFTSNLRIVQAGGYIPVQIDFDAIPEEEELVEIIVFINKDEFSIDSYRELGTGLLMNIYEAYYENCMYPYIIEFCVEPAEADRLVPLLKQLPRNPDVGMYKECRIQEA